MNTSVKRNVILSILLPIGLALVAYCIILMVMYRYLPCQLPDSMHDGQVTEWIDKSQLWLNPLRGLLYIVVIFLIDFIFHFVTKRISPKRRNKQIEERKPLSPKKERLVFWYIFAFTFLFSAYCLLDGLKKIFYDHFQVLANLSDWFLIAAGILLWAAIIPIVIVGIIQSRRQKKSPTT